MVAGALLYAFSGQGEADAKELSQNLVDYMHHTTDGDQAMADLDAATIAANITTMTGDSVVAMAVWGFIQ